MVQRMSASQLRAARLDIKARLRAGERVPTAEKKAVGYGGWGRYTATKPLTRKEKAISGLVDKGLDIDTAKKVAQKPGKVLLSGGRSMKKLEAELKPGETGYRVTPSKQAVRSQKMFTPELSPFHPDYVPETKQKSYWISKKDKIEFETDDAGSIVGITDYGAGISMAAGKGQQFNPKSLELVQKTRVRKRESQILRQKKLEALTMVQLKDMEGTFPNLEKARKDVSPFLPKEKKTVTFLDMPAIQRTKTGKAFTTKIADPGERVSLSYFRGGAKAIREEPLKAAAIGGIAFATALVGPSIVAAAPIIGTGAKVVGLGLGVKYVSGIVGDAGLALEKGTFTTDFAESLGGRMTTEIIPASAGSFFGTGVSQIKVGTVARTPSGTVVRGKGVLGRFGVLFEKGQAPKLGTFTEPAPTPLMMDTASKSSRLSLAPVSARDSFFVRALDRMGDGLPITGAAVVTPGPKPDRSSFPFGMFSDKSAKVGGRSAKQRAGGNLMKQQKYGRYVSPSRYVPTEKLTLTNIPKTSQFFPKVGGATTALRRKGELTMRVPDPTLKRVARVEQQRLKITLPSRTPEPSYPTLKFGDKGLSAKWIERKRGGAVPSGKWISTKPWSPKVEKIKDVGYRYYTKRGALTTFGGTSFKGARYPQQKQQGPRSPDLVGVSKGGEFDIGVAGKGFLVQMRRQKTKSLFKPIVPKLEPKKAGKVKQPRRFGVGGRAGVVVGGGGTMVQLGMPSREQLRQFVEPPEQTTYRGGFRKGMREKLFTRIRGSRITGMVQSDSSFKLPKQPKLGSRSDLGLGLDTFTGVDTGSGLRAGLKPGGKIRPDTAMDTELGFDTRIKFINIPGIDTGTGIRADVGSMQGQRPSQRQRQSQSSAQDMRMKAITPLKLVTPTRPPKKVRFLMGGPRKGPDSFDPFKPQVPEPVRRPRPPRPDEPKDPDPTIIKPPTFGFEKTKRKARKKKAKKGKFKTKRTPSLEASVFNIRARRINPRVYSTGLELRPIQI